MHLDKSGMQKVNLYEVCLTVNVEFLTESFFCNFKL